MPEGREQIQKRIEQERQYAKEHIDIEFKAAGYLLAAHAAGFAGYVALLKDYATVPQLKGIGIFIALFGFGLIAAICGFIAITIHNEKWLGSFLDISAKEANPPNPKLYVWLVFVPSTISCMLLISAVSLIVGRFSLL